ncbi:MAG TPA: phosphoribosyltransferase family protein [Thermomicrobiales bacterium]|nr:phosphoribosyltransferase family protein [Thermomicrobiales bacterium]
MTAVAQRGASQPPLPLFSTSGGIVTPNALPTFAHPAEQELAKLLSFFNVRWTYEPTTFALRRHDDGTIAEAFTPDFFLPDHRLYLELTTMRQKLVTRKNRKARLLRELYPNVRLHLIYRRDFLRLMECYGSELARGESAGAETVLRTEAEIAQAVQGFAAMIAARRQRSRSPEPVVLVTASRSSRRFQRHLADELDGLGIPVEIASLQTSKPDSPFSQPRFRASQKAIASMNAGHVVLVETLVSSGLSVTHAQRWLLEREIPVRQTLALFARNGFHVGDLALDAVAFEAPHDVLAGYGLQLRAAYADRPQVVSLRAAPRYPSETLAALGIR